MDALDTIGVSPYQEARLTLARKAVLAGAAYLSLTIPYYSFQYVRLFSATPLAPSALDRWIVFRPQTAPLYLSLFILLGIAPLLFTKREDFARYTAGVTLIGLVSNLIFLFFPTSVARPEAGSVPLAYALIVSVDRPLNACPSLHAGLAVFAALSLTGQLRSRRSRAALWLWTLAILYATLATRQHVLVDLVAGAAVALLMFWWRPKSLGWLL